MYSHNRGFTLVELLVAMVLGLMLSAGIVNVYLENRRNYMQDEEMARLQENARYALSLLKRELGMVGFLGGLRDYSTLLPESVSDDCVSTGDWALDLDDELELIDAVTPGETLDTNSGTTWTCINSNTLEQGTDIISVKRTADLYTVRNGERHPDVSEDGDQWYLRLLGNTDFSWEYLADGESLPSSATDGSMDVDYWEFYSKIFYIRDYADEAGDGIPTLCVTELQGGAMEERCLVEGVEDMQLEIGIDEDVNSVPERFESDPSADQIEEAVVARLYLLVRSVNEIADYTNGKEYNLGSKHIDAKDDGYLRRVFSTTVQLRNMRLPNA